jgi:hypothetical protein
MGREVFIGIGVSVEGNGENVGCGVAEGNSMAVEVAVCVSAIAVLTMARAVSIACVGCVLITGRKPLQDVKIIVIRNSEIIALPKIFTFPLPF